MAHISSPTVLPDEEIDTTAIQSVYEIKAHGLLPLIIARSINRNDTVASAHLATLATPDKTCLYIAGQGTSLAYSGIVKLTGLVKLPNTSLRPAHIKNELIKLETAQPIILSGPTLPDLGKLVKKAFMGSQAILTELKNITRKDSLYYNSFLRPAQQVVMREISSINIKGNIIITSPDSIRVSASAHLEDVILMAPKISFQDNFQGRVQAFASQKIEVGKNVTLTYPSALCVNNTLPEKGGISFKENSSIYGALVVYGNDMLNVKNNSITIPENCLLPCDIYCSGWVDIKSNVYGSVYTNRFTYATPTAVYDNCIYNIEINSLKRPDYFMPIPLFDTDDYGALKKVM
jgi:hypothetical protein